ncbi:T9SS type A sorting domain-containing protein [Ferruginibacter sp. SUN002]|uniref:T9SS type A sorting domain-containing protein n=1 Tax=Ferruginibacter sp. SUN002 TaxID=2937789 RepID=UPI003D35B8D2
MKSLLLALALLLCSNTYCQYNFYYGNLHSHTAYSDGNKDSATTGYKTPGQSYAYTKGSYHMDFLGIAEHNHFSSANNPGMHLADYAKGVYQADTANNEGTFVCMYGMEWGVIDNGGHLVTYGIPGLVGWESGSGGWGPTNNYNIFCAKTDYSKFWQIVNSYPNAFCTLAHPQDFDYNNLIEGTLNTSADSAVVGVAVRSGAAFSTTTDYSDAVPSSYSSVYYEALGKGFHVGPNCDQDNHYTNFGRTNKMRTVVLAKSLKRDSIMAAYRAMRFYASDDWNVQVNFTVNGFFMGSDTTAASNSAIQVSVVDPDAGDNVSRIDIYYGVPGSGLNPTSLRSITNNSVLNYTHTTTLGNKFYYFVRVIQADGDIIWTAPIWIYRNLNTTPIHLIDFDGIQKDEQINLSWTTALDYSVDYFEVERSVDGTNFSFVSELTANNTNYSFTDVQPVNGLNFYRLKQINGDGSFVYSSTIAINFNNPVVKIIQINPNPVVDQLTIICTAKNKEQITCKIYSSEGREVKNIAVNFKPGENKITTDVSKLASGNYFVVISKPDVRITESKFVKL